MATTMPEYDPADGTGAPTHEDQTGQRERVRLKLLSGVFSRTAQAILRMTSREELFADACRIAVEHGRLRMAWVAVLDEPTQLMRAVAASGHLSGYLDDIRISNADENHRGGPILSAFHGEGPFVCFDTARDPAFAQWRDAALARGYRSMAAFPMRVRGAIVAVFSVYSSEPGWFGAAEVELLDALVSEIGVALELLERQRERERVDVELEQERALSAAIFDTMPGMLYLVDDKGTLVRWNKQTETVLGYTSAELRNKLALELCHPQDLQAATDSMLEVFRDGRAQVETRLITKTGEELAFYLTGVRLMIDDRPYLLGVGIDVTARRQAERDKQSSDRLLSAIIESSEDAIFSRSLDGRALSWNAGAARLYGYTQEEITADPPPPFVPEDKAAELHLALERAGRGETVPYFETQRRRKDGALVDVSLSVSPLRDEHGRIIGASGIARDITERKRADAQVRRLREELETQRLKTFRATMTTVHDIVNNFLASLQLVRFEGESQLSPEYISLFDQLISGTAAELKALGDLHTVRETTMSIGMGIEYRCPAGRDS